MNRDPSSRTIRSEKIYRIMVVTLLLGTAALGVGLILFANTFLQALEPSAQESPGQAWMTRGLFLLGITMLAGLPVIGLGTYLAYLGHQLRTTCQVSQPEPGASVECQFTNGISAKMRGTLLTACGGLMILSALVLPLVVWWMTQTR